MSTVTVIILIIEFIVFFGLSLALMIEDDISKKNGKPNFFQRHGWE